MWDTLNQQRQISFKTLFATNFEILYNALSKKTTDMLLKIFANRLEAATKLMVKFRFIQPYWINITTKQPSCIYYFGPFNSYAEAKQMRHGYIEDLVEERAIGISIKIERSLPARLTITEEESLF